MNMVIAVVIATACSADSVTVGTHNLQGYNAEYVALADGRASVYWEREFEAHKDLVIGQYRLGEDATAIVRFDSPNWLRPGLKTGLGHGKSRFTFTLLAPTGDAPAWLEVYTPPFEVAQGLTLESHCRFKSRGKSDLWVGPRYRARCGDQHNIDLWYRYNLRKSGSWEGGLDATVLRW